jgi:pimeloyl-ACP methyl ester carboxylesterase
MAKTIHALLVGINAYTQAPLRGCINDLLALDAFFKKHCKNSGQAWNPRYLLGPHDDDKPAIARQGIADWALPTRANVVAGFEHFSQKNIAEGDICLFFYCGHGSQEPAAPEFAHLKADGMNETLVCLDSRQPGGRDLVDKELAWLLWRASRQNPGAHFLVVMDCCHSGSNTRADEGDIRTRDAVARRIGTPFQELLGIKDLGDETARLFSLQNGRAYYHEEGKYVHLAAARDSETAKELKLDGQPRGAFTWSLLRVLEQGGTDLSYREIMRRTEALVRNRVRGQIPQLDAPEQAMETQQFLGGALPSMPTEYPLQFLENEWRLLAGSLQGIVAGNAAAPTIFELTDGSQIRATAQTVFPNYTLLDAAPFGEKQRNDPELRAVVSQMAAPKISIFVEAEMPAAQRGFLKDETEKKPLRYADLGAAESAEADYVARWTGSHYALLRKDSSVPVFLRQEKAYDFLQYCEAVGKWRFTLEMHNPHTKIRREDIEITAEIIEGQAVNPQTLNELKGRELQEPEALTLRYEQRDGRWHAPALRCKVRLKQDSWWVGGLFLDYQFGIGEQLTPRQHALGQEHLFRFQSGGTTFNAIPLTLDKRLADAGVTEITDYLKIFVSTSDFKLADFRQEPLPLDYEHLRNMGFEDEGVVARPDWTVVTIPVKILRPAAPAPANGLKVAGFELKMPAALRATASLHSVSEVRQRLEATPLERGEKAELEKLVLPPASIWGKNPADDDVFTRGFEVQSDAVPSILELTQVEGQLDAPIVLDMAQKIGDDEVVVPYGYDAETGLYLPMGITNAEGDIEIHTLPEQTPGLIAGEADFGERNFKQSIKLFFKKLIHNQLDNTLALVNPDASRDSDLASIRGKVKTAREILLVTHGFLGNTEDKREALMVLTYIHRSYDVVLSFDYENLKTDIRDTAKDLFERLKSAGVFDGEQPRLTIIGSSMGGLVTRWMVEKLGAARYVKHLLLVASPSQGTDIAEAKERLFGLLGRALSGVALLKPYIVPLAFLAKKADKELFVTLRQMHPKKSDLLPLLNGDSAPAPGLRYSMLGGNTKGIVAEPSESGNFWKRLKFFLKKRLKYTLMDWLVFEGDNDMVVPVDSQKGMPGLRADDTAIVPVDHLSYFIEEKGLVELERFLVAEEPLNSVPLA